jgi:hypothetical protein
MALEKTHTNINTVTYVHALNRHPCLCPMPEGVRYVAPTFLSAGSRNFPVPFFCVKTVSPFWLKQTDRQTWTSPGVKIIRQQDRLTVGGIPEGPGAAVIFRRRR